MRRVAILGAGKIGSLIAVLLLSSTDYIVSVVDIDFSGDDQDRLDDADPNLKKLSCDVQDEQALAACFEAHQQDAVISCLPYYCNEVVAKIAKTHHLHYFDLTEDTQVTDAVKQFAQGAKTAFVPQCGLAPGFIGIAAHSIMKKFDSLDIVKLRVGALPINTSNSLQYAWDGAFRPSSHFCTVDTELAMIRAKTP